MEKETDSNIVWALYCMGITEETSVKQIMILCINQKQQQAAHAGCFLCSWNECDNLMDKQIKFQLKICVFI